VSLLRFALITPETREAHCGAEFPRLGLLLTRNTECALEILFGFRRTSLRLLDRDFARNSINLGVTPPFLGIFRHSHRSARIETDEKYSLIANIELQPDPSNP
jgi:hypothetical protein